MFVDVVFLKNLLMALFLGSTIGLERQWRQRGAGLRTIALVSVGAALFVMATDAVGTLGDHARIAAQVVSGIGFLGAGVIMRDGLSVRGLNTAATLWSSGAVGVLCGYGLNARAFAGTIAILIANVFLRSVAQRVNREPVGEDAEVRYRLRLECRPEDEGHVRFLLLQSLAAGPLVLQALQSEDATDGRRVRVSAEVIASSNKNGLVESTVSRLSVEPGVTLASWTVKEVEENGHDRVRASRGFSFARLRLK